MAALAEAWRYAVIARTGWPCVSRHVTRRNCMFELGTFISAHELLQGNPSLRYSTYLLDALQATKELRSDVAVPTSDKDDIS